MEEEAAEEGSHAGWPHYDSAGEYIEHHLQNLQVCLDHGEVVWNHCTGNFLALNVDSMFWAIACGVLFLWLFRTAAKRATRGNPGRFQAFVEMIIVFINDSVKDVFTSGKKNALIAPLSLTLFIWIVLMNTMDLVPVDWIPTVASVAGVPYQKVVPTTDVNITFGLSISVFILTIYYSIKIKGPIGFLGELTFHPIAPPMKGIAIIAAPLIILFNLLLESVALLARPVSHSLRLFGNLFAGFARNRRDQADSSRARPAVRQPNERRCSGFPSSYARLRLCGASLHSRPARDGFQTVRTECECPRVACCRVLPNRVQRC